jgi:hypothetical protein
MRSPPSLPRSFAPVVVFVAFVLFVLLAGGGARVASGASRDRHFFSARQGVGLEAPMGWTLSLHTGYPEILCVLLHPDGSRISLSVAPTKAADGQALAEQSRRGLEAQHLAVSRIVAGPRGGVLVDAHGTTHGAALRQLYLARPAGAGKTQGIVLTLSTRTETLTAAVTAFDWTVAHLALEAPAGADEPVVGGAKARAAEVAHARVDEARAGRAPADGSTAQGAAADGGR